MLRFHRGRRHGLVVSAIAALGCWAFEVEASAVPHDQRATIAMQTLPDWTMFQGNAGHTGYVPTRLDPANFSLRWQIPVQTVHGWLLPGVASMATSEGLVYVSGGTVLHVYNESDGKHVWQHDFGDLQFPSVNPPAISKGVVYVAAGQQASTYMFGLNALTGAAEFRSAMSSQWENYFAPTVGPKGVYTDAGTYGGLYGFTRAGQQRFFVAEAQQSLWTPAVDDAGVYSYTGYLQVVDPKTGATTHYIDDDTFENYTYEIGGSPVLGTPGSVFVANYVNTQLNGGSMTNTLLDFSVDTDSIAWKVTGHYPTTPAYHAGHLYVVDNNPLQLEVRAETDGALEWYWSAPAGDTQFVSEVLLTRNLVFVSTDVATYAINLKSHKAVWSYPKSGKLALSKSGVLYIQGSYTLTAIDVM